MIADSSVRSLSWHHAKMKRWDLITPVPKAKTPKGPTGSSAPVNLHLHAYGEGGSTARHKDPTYCLAPPGQKG